MKTIVTGAGSTLPQATNRGAPQMNSVILLGAPGAIAEGDTIEIGNDTYEFRSSTPPTGGTAGNILVFNGADSAASRANFIKAVNGTVDAAVVTRTAEEATAGTNTEMFFARAGTTLGTVDILSTSRVGTGASPVTANDVCATYGATSTTRTVGSTATDVWNDITTYGGGAEGGLSFAWTEVEITTNMITAGHVEIPFTFTPLVAFVTCSSYPGVYAAAWTINSKQVHVALAGGGHAAGQLANADKIQVLAIG